MARDTKTQAMTISSENLVIGLSQIRVAEISGIDSGSPTLSGVAGTPSPDTDTSPLGKDESIGAIQAGGLETTLTTKEHSSGYPAQVDWSVTESTEAVYNITMEELLGTKGLAIFNNILDTLDNGTVHHYAMESLAMFQAGHTGSIYSPVTVLKPELNLSLSNDWSGLPVQFEALYKSAFLNNKLYYWKKDSTPTSRDRTLQPITLNPSDLMIGEMQFRLGNFATRNSGLGATYAVRKSVGAKETTMLIASGGTYTGSLDGAFVITIETGGADGTAKYTLTDLEGNVSSAVTIPSGGGVHTIGTDVTTSGLSSSVGVTLTFSAGTYVLDDVYVAGVSSDDAMSQTQTNIYCPYPYLPYTNSIGSITSTNVTSDISYKDHKSGYPEKKDSSIMESSEVKMSCNVEEFNMTESNFSAGYGVTLYDALLDASRSGADYFAPLEAVITTVSGKTLSLWAPNVKINPQASVNPSNDWANSPVEFMTLTQSGITSVKRLQILVRD